MVTASFASTWRLTDGRFSLGLGQGIDRAMRAYGMTTTTTADLEVAANLYRRLWRGETVMGHTDRAGSYPVLRLDADFDEPIPLSIVAFGPNTLELAGRAFDRVVLHTFFTDETTSRAVRTVKESAERAGRNPDDVEVWSCFATIGDHLSHDVRIKKTVGRLATYLQAYGDLMVSTNDWDPAVRGVSGRSVRVVLRRRRRQSHHRRTRARRHASSPTNGSLRPPPARSSSASLRCPTSSTSVATGSSSTARIRPNCNRSSTAPPAP
ncbi:MAG: LLM class flavin-dependent oxidoreductase [Acidimicrobiales bacterium]